MTDRLVAWLHETPVAVLLPAPELRVRLEWRAEGIERWGLGSPVLSVGLPIGTRPAPGMRAAWISSRTYCLKDLRSSG